MSQHYIIKPYKIGANRKSVGMTILGPVVKSLGIDPLSEYLLLKVSGKDNLPLKVLRREEFDKEESRKADPASTGNSH